MERLLVRPKDLSIIVEKLAADKIEKSSSCVRGTADQRDVGIGEIDNFRHGKVVCRALLFDGIQGKFPASRTVVKLQMVVRDETIRDKTLGTEANQLGERIGSRRLETRQDRDSLKERGLP